MEKRDVELIEKLIGEDEELRRLVKEHEELEERLERYQSKTYLTAEEEMDRKRIKKLKLAGMDRIESILSRYRGE